MLPHSELEALGYTIAAYPVTLLSAEIKAMRETLAAIKTGKPKNVEPHLLSFADLCDTVGFNKYYEVEKRYREDDTSAGGSSKINSTANAAAEEHPAKKRRGANGKGK